MFQLDYTKCWRFVISSQQANENEHKTYLQLMLDIKIK